MQHSAMLRSAAARVAWANADLTDSRPERGPLDCVRRAGVERPAAIDVQQRREDRSKDLRFKFIHRVNLAPIRVVRQPIRLSAAAKITMAPVAGSATPSAADAPFERLVPTWSRQTV